MSEYQAPPGVGFLNCICFVHVFVTIITVMITSLEVIHQLLRLSTLSFALYYHFCGLQTEYNFDKSVFTNFPTFIPA